MTEWEEGRASRDAVVAAGHRLFVYVQRMSHRIQVHRLEKVFPLPDEELQAFIDAIDKSSEARAALNGEK
jgi:hypothetical protein